MNWLEISVLLIIWTGAILSAVTGAIWNPNMLVWRKNDPVYFWKAYWIVFGLSVIVTAGILATRFLQG